MDGIRYMKSGGREGWCVQHRGLRWHLDLAEEGRVESATSMRLCDASSHKVLPSGPVPIHVEREAQVHFSLGDSVDENSD